MTTLRALSTPVLVIALVWALVTAAVGFLPHGPLWPPFLLAVGLLGALYAAGEVMS